MRANSRCSASSICATRWRCSTQGGYRAPAFLGRRGVTCQVIPPPLQCSARARPKSRRSPKRDDYMNSPAVPTRAPHGTLHLRARLAFLCSFPALCSARPSFAADRSVISKTGVKLITHARFPFAIFPLRLDARELRGPVLATFIFGLINFWTVSFPGRQFLFPCTGMESLEMIRF